MTYFSEREKGECVREHEDISTIAWGGIQAQIFARIEDGSFGASFPETCIDGPFVVGTDKNSLWQAMRAEIPNLQDCPWYTSSEEAPQTLDILDIIEFCWQQIGEPIRDIYHQHFKHYHLLFDVELGRDKFREKVNEIFRRNGLVYSFTEQGCIERLVEPVLHENLKTTQFNTGESELDRLLGVARSKILGPDKVTRSGALEALWDAWERLKTLDSNSDKKAQITSLLDTTAGLSSPKFRLMLEQEANELTAIGNNFNIRHSETTQEQLADSEHIDYLFHRLFILIQIILRMNKKT